jgi:hypothetical protein
LLMLHLIAALNPENQIPMLQPAYSVKSTEL